MHKARSLDPGRRRAKLLFKHIVQRKTKLIDISLICSQRCLSDPLSPILENSTLSNFQQVDGYVAGKIVIKLLNLERVLYIH